MSPREPITIDDSRFPLVVVTFTGVATDAQFRAYLDTMTRMLHRRRSSVLILDSTDCGPTPPTHRKMQSEWLKEHEPMLRKYSIGTAFVITSAIVRGILTAILWFSPLTAPHTVVATRAEAERWCEQRLREEGVMLPGRRRSA